MKSRTQKLLLALYPSTDTERFQLPVSVLRELSELTPGGFRSVLHHLEKTEQIMVLRLEDTLVELQPAAKTHLRDSFPALRSMHEDWDGTFTQVVFLEAPKADRQFRRLRGQLTSIGAHCLTRGVYLVAGTLPAGIQADLKVLYQGSVVVTTVDEWQFGSNPLLNELKSNSEQVYHLYSGISTRLFKLLSIQKSQKVLNTKKKEQLFSDYNQFWETIGLDQGYLPFFHTTSFTALEVLKQFQSILSRFHSS